MINKDTIFDYAREISRDKSTLATFIFTVIGAFVIGGYFLHGWYSARVQRQAQFAFTQSLEIYQQALAKDLTATEEKKDNDWDESDLAFKTAYDQNKHSKISPFYLVYRAQSLAQEGEIEKSINILNDAISKFSNDKHFLNLFKITKSLILFNGSIDDKKSAVENLDKLANDKENPLQDMALYYLGEYYSSENDNEKAKEAFTKASELEFKNDLNLTSPWVEKSKEKLSTF